MKKLRVVRKSFVGLVKKLSKQEHKAKEATSRLTKLKRHFSLLRSKLNRLTRLMVSKVKAPNIPYSIILTSV